MKNDPDHTKKMNLRSEARTKSRENASVEFIPGNNKIAYHFKLRDFSSKGFGIMVRKDSKVLNHIKAGDVLDMKYYPEEATRNPVSHRTQIKHISDPELGKHQDHILIGLFILEKS
ncbi:hypothetical protein [Desulfobacula sp.]|uniref:hypothetical protein n=1 Tax=Desulfobacula sp. TaxID=2593537 RepID=UPI00262F48E7|nr:hypothetical protein [Desulfobacula sp.]